MGLKEFFKKTFNREEYEREKAELRKKREIDEANSFYEKYKTDIEHLIDEKNGYLNIFYAPFELDGKTYESSWGGLINRKIKKIISDKFQMDIFGKIIFDDDFDADMKNDSGNTWYCVGYLESFSSAFGFCGDYFYKEYRNPYLKWLINYNKMNPSKKISRYILNKIRSTFESLASRFVEEEYGENYLTMPSKLSVSEREEKAWSNEKLHRILDNYADPENPNSEILFAENIETVSVQQIFDFIFCDDLHKRDLFFEKGTNKLLPSDIIDENIEKLYEQNYKSGL